MGKTKIVRYQKNCLEQHRRKNDEEKNNAGFNCADFDFYHTGHYNSK